MPLYTPPAPAPALHAVLTALKAPSTAGQARFLRSAGGVITPRHPHPVHVLDPAAPPHRALATAQVTGWRFLLHDEEDNLVGSAEAVQGQDGWAPPFFSEGPFVASTHRAMLQAQAFRNTYEPRLLSVPDLYMLALWLHADAAPEASADVLVPLAPAPPGIAAHRPQQAATLLTALSHRLAAAPLLSNSA